MVGKIYNDALRSSGLRPRIRCCCHIFRLHLFGLDEWVHLVGNRDIQGGESQCGCKQSYDLRWRKLIGKMKVLDEMGEY